MRLILVNITSPIMAVIAILAIVAMLGSACTKSRYSPSKKTEDEKLYLTNCRGCHSLPKTNDYNEAKWISIEQKHTNRINISPEEFQKVKEFIQSKEK